MRISDWSSDVCSSDLALETHGRRRARRGDRAWRHPAFADGYPHRRRGIDLELSLPLARLHARTRLHRAAAAARRLWPRARHLPDLAKAERDGGEGDRPAQPRRSRRRSEEGRVGKEGVSKSRFRGLTSNKKKKTQQS